MMRRPLALLAILVPLTWVAGSPGTADAAVVTSVRGDTLTISGDGADDTVVLRLQAGAPDKLVVEAGTSSRSFDRASFSRISIRTGGGADDIRIDEADGAFSDTEAVTIESGAGRDAVTGGRGAEVISTGDDGDLVLANGGGDRLLLGAGDDTAIQASEDGADVIEGQSGTDTLRISGTSESEEFTVQASGGRALISRDVGSGRADTVGIEVAEVDAGGGPDLVDVGNLSGTALARVDADLGVADGARDTVFAAGSPVRDTIFVSASGDTARVTGLPGEVRVENASSTEDRLTVQGSGGNDEIRALGAVGTIVDLVLEGNDGLDNITGGVAVEVLRGGPGPDTLRGFQGADTIEGGTARTWCYGAPRSTATTPYEATPARTTPCGSPAQAPPMPTRSSATAHRSESAARPRRSAWTRSRPSTSEPAPVPTRSRSATSPAPPPRSSAWIW